MILVLEKIQAIIIVSHSNSHHLKILIIKDKQEKERY